MKLLAVLVLVLSACDQAIIDGRDGSEPSIDGRWTSSWRVDGSDDKGDWSTRHVLVLTETEPGFCTAELFCECTRPEYTPVPPGTRFWEGTRSSSHLTMQSTHLVTGAEGTMTATVGAHTMTAHFSWGETITFTRETY